MGYLKSDWSEVLVHSVMEFYLESERESKREVFSLGYPIYTRDLLGLTIMLLD